MSLKIFAFADEAGSSISAQIAAMKRNGLQGVELRGTEFGNVSDLDAQQAKEIAKRLSDEGLKVWSLGSPLGKIGVTAPMEPELEKLKRTIETAHIMNTENIRMFSFYLPREAEPSEFKNAVMDRLAQMAEIADGTGVYLCHENEKGIYGENDTRCLEILTEIPSIKGIFDPANFIQSGVDTLLAWQLLKDRIHYLHIKDALADGRVVPAGRGIGNVKAIVGDFMAMGGSAVTIEPHLTVFSGLEGLEREGERSQVGEVYVYPDSDSAFDAACSALKEII